MQRLHSPEAQHRPLPSSKGLVRVLRAIVGPAARFLAIADAEIPQRCTVRSQQIRHNLIRGTMTFQRFLQEFQCGFLVARLRHKTFEHFALVINGSPQIMPLAIDFNENLVLVPSPVAGPHALDATLSDLCCKHWPEPVPPKPHRFMADVYPSLVQKIFDVAKRQWELDVEHHRQADDLGRGPEALERVGFCHFVSLSDRHARHKTVYGPFADAWRVTDATSLFDYAPGKSAASYVNRDVPADTKDFTVADLPPADITGGEAACASVSSKPTRCRAEKRYGVCAEVGPALTSGSWPAPRRAGAPSPRPCMPRG